MTTLSIDLEEETMLRLKKLAEEAGIAPEELTAAHIEEWLVVSKDEFVEAAAFVLRKNSELYRRLAK